MIRSSDSALGNDAVPAMGDMIDWSAGRLLIFRSDGGPEPVSEVVLDGGNVTIGRAASCTVSLGADQLVSRLHAILRFDGSRYTIADLASSNGTLLNGRLLGDLATLDEGDRITVGNHTLIYTLTVPVSHTSQPGAAQQASTASEQLATAQPPDALASGQHVPQTSPDPLLEPTLAPTPPSVAPPTTPVHQPLAASAPAAASAAPQAPQDQRQAQNTGQLQQLRSQLMQSSTILAEWAEATAKRTRHTRAELAALAQSLETTLAQARHGLGADQPDLALADVLRLAEQAESGAQPPEVTQALAARAADIATIARTQATLIAALESLHSRLADLSRL